MSFDKTVTMISLYTYRRSVLAQTKSIKLVGFHGFIECNKVSRLSLRSDGDRA